ncbi:MAG: tetratricopeptide repeat protein [Gemmatimonadaceae bacterium]|nr:tetratricopeptide repeat protein [Gloeobacterales cyanobacterium ES-bin-141]
MDAAQFYHQAVSRALMEDFLGAIEDFDRVIHLNPNDADAFYNRGFVRYKLGNKQGAIEDYTKAVCINPKKAAAYLNRGSVRLELADEQGAIEDYTQTILLNSTCLEAYYHRGRARSCLGDYHGAIEDFNRTLNFNPTFADACNQRGDARLNLKDEQRAVQDYQKAEKLYREQGMTNECQVVQAKIEAISTTSTPNQFTRGANRYKVDRYISAATITGKPPKRYINVMEKLVTGEFDIQIARLPKTVQAQINRTDAEAWALNHLPAQYATSQRWVHRSTEKLLEKHREQITAAVKQGITVVFKNNQPPESPYLPDSSNWDEASKL